MSDKIYLGKGRASDEYGLINASICLSDIPKEKITTAKNGKKYLNITVARMKEPDKYNKTHTVYIDEYKPKDNQENTNLPY